MSMPAALPVGLVHFLKESSFWQVYTSEETFLPFFIPLIFWIGTYVYAEKNKKHLEYHKWYTIHNIHNFMAIGMGLTCMYINDATIFNERIGILWSWGYFMVDAYDCLVRGDMTYLAHALFCFGLGVANYKIPALRRLHMNSKATLLESSNPFMHLCRTTRNPVHFAIFALVFTLCRVIWVPILYHQCISEGMSRTEPAILALYAFYCLNLSWYYKIIKILIDGLTGKKPEKDA